jgi:predicted ATP-binding protein involved in virulence
LWAHLKQTAMSKEPVYIREISITDYKSFRGENKFSFYDSNGQWCQWTVFLGNNNTGKTNLLKAIAAMEPTEIEFEDVSRKEYVASNLIKRYIPLDIDSRINLSIIRGKATEDMYITGRMASVSYESWCADLSIFGYGVVRELENPQTIISRIDTQMDNASNLLNNTKLAHFESWLLQLDYSAKNAERKETKNEAERQLSLLKEILTSDIFPEISDVNCKTDEKLNNYVEYLAAGEWLKFSSLGYGYQSALAWIADFCKKLFEKYPDSENPLAEPAVLLIDEIDLHLHPYWQRTIAKHLTKIFPKTQFIVTTHSPFVIQSMDKVNLYTLHHDNQQTSVRHYENASFEGWGIEEILRDVMELGENIKSDKYQKLINSFDAALDANDYKAARKAHEELKKILNTYNGERKLLEIQLSQLSPEDD